MDPDSLVEKYIAIIKRADKKNELKKFTIELLIKYSHNKYYHYIH